MIGITHKQRLEQILSNLSAMYDEISHGYYEDDSLQTAVYCQAIINKMVWKLNRLNYGGEEYDANVDDIPMFKESAEAYKEWTDEDMKGGAE